MPALVSKKFRLHNAKQFVEAFDEDAGFTTFANTTAGDTSLETNMYLFIGGISAFTDDTNPPTPTDSVANSYYENWRDMIAAKKVTSADVTHCITRTNWANNTAYFAYTHANNALQDQSFYVVTDEYNVYKCLANNNSGGTSQAKPTGTGTAIITPGADGYKWKFMYTISASDAIKFLSTDFMPVKFITSDPGAGQPYKTQYDAQQAAVDGAIYRIKVTAGGSGYSSTPTVTISGNGSSATATATVAGNAVTAITVNNVGTGYNQATVTISGGGGSGATAVAVISPEGGHSSNPVHELGGFYVMNNVRLEYADGSGDFPVSNDYRRIGLIRDPFDFGTTNVATAATLSACKTITLQSGGLSGTFVVDETITGGTSSAQGKVVNWDSTNRILKYYQDINTGFGTFQTSETISGGTSSASGTSSALGNPEVAADSGDIMYLEHRRPINRASDQIEDIKLVVEF